MDYLIPFVWSAVGIISNLVAFMFFAVFTQKQPDIPLQVYDTVEAASSVLSTEDDGQECLDYWTGLSSAQSLHQHHR